MGEIHSVLLVTRAAQYLEAADAVALRNTNKSCYELAEWAADARSGYATYVTILERSRRVETAWYCIENYLRWVQPMMARALCRPMIWLGGVVWCPSGNTCRVLFGGVEGTLVYKNDEVWVSGDTETPYRPEEYPPWIERTKHNTDKFLMFTVYYSSIPRVYGNKGTVKSVIGKHKIELISDNGISGKVTRGQMMLYLLYSK